jgi:hypothetical protein
MTKNTASEVTKPLMGPIKQWNSTFFAFSLIIEGATEKVLQFMRPVQSIYNLNLGFIEQKIEFLNTTEKFKQ